MKSLFLYPILWVVAAGIIPAGLFTENASAQEGPVIKILKYHDGPVNAVGFHPSKKLILSASSDKTIKIYDLNQEKVTETLPFNREVHAAAWTPDGRFIIAGAGTLLQVFTLNGELFKTYRGHTTAIWSLEPGPAGRFVVTGSYEKSFNLWDIIEGKLVQTFKGHEKSVLAVAFSPTGEDLSSGSLDQSVRIWKVADFSGKPVAKTHRGNVVDLEFSPDGKLLASASRDQTVALWDIPAGENKGVLNHPSEVFSVCFAPDAPYLVSGTLHGEITLWDLPTHKMIASFKNHSAAVLSIDFAKDGRQFASASYDGTIVLWNTDPEIFVQFAFPDSLSHLNQVYPSVPERQKGESRSDFLARRKEVLMKRAQKMEEYYLLYCKRSREVDTDAQD